MLILAGEVAERARDSILGLGAGLEACFLDFALVAFSRAFLAAAPDNFLYLSALNSTFMGTPRCSCSPRCPWAIASG